MVDAREPMTVDYRRARRLVGTVEELDAVLDDLTLAAERDQRPLIAQLGTVDGSRGLQIALGRRSYSTLEYDDVTDRTRPRLHSAIGTLPTPETDEFDYYGTPTRVRPGSAVSVAAARRAAREFFQTRRRPGGMQWRDGGGIPTRSTLFVST